MSAPLSPHSLIAEGQLKERLAALSIKTDAIDLVLACESATEEIESYLDRALIAHRVTEHTVYARAGSEVYARDWPIVGAVSVGVDVVDARKGHLLVNQPQMSLVYIAGYRRSDQDADALGLVLPEGVSIPLLPSLVTDVALSLAAVRVQQLGKTLTMDTTVSMGQGTTKRTRQQGTIKIDVDPVQAQLDRLSHMRRLSV